MIFAALVLSVLVNALLFAAATGLASELRTTRRYAEWLMQLARTGNRTVGERAIDDLKSREERGSE